MYVPITELEAGDTETVKICNSKFYILTQLKILSYTFQGIRYAIVFSLKKSNCFQ